MTVGAMYRVVCRAYGLRENDLFTSDRKSTGVLARQVAMYCAHRFFGASFNQVGKAFERDHTTAMHAKKVVERRLVMRDYKIARVVTTIEAMLRDETPVCPACRRPYAA